MTEHKHTPGPWRVEESKSSKQRVRVRCENATVAQVCALIHQEANAALIAAAPDLLAALEAVVDCHAALTRHVGHSDDTAVCLVTARTAIAKAKGAA